MAQTQWQSGDTWEAIAQRYQVPLARLYLVNNQDLDGGIPVPLADGAAVILPPEAVMPPPRPVAVAPNANPNGLSGGAVSAGYILTYRILDTLEMAPDQLQALAGMDAGSLPEISGADPLVTGGGVASYYLPNPNWYYRVISIGDARNLLGGNDLVPFKDLVNKAMDPLEMTFRQLRVDGAKKTGTNRISTAKPPLTPGRIEAFATTMKDRGTGKLVRVDVDAARRLGSDFLEFDTIIDHLDAFESSVRDALAKARAAGASKTTIRELESRLIAIPKCRQYAESFREGQAVGRIPIGAISNTSGTSIDTVAAALARERLFLTGLKFVRFGGRVLLVVGAVESVVAVATAPSGQAARVASEQAGGWAFSIAGGELGAAAGAQIGGWLGFETGPGAIVAAAFGAIVGGTVGFVGGEQVATDLYDAIDQVSNLPENVGRLFNNTPLLLETTTMMFGSDDAKRQFEDLRQLESGDPFEW